MLVHKIQRWNAVRAGLVWDKSLRCNEKLKRYCTARTSTPSREKTKLGHDEITL